MDTQIFDAGLIDFKSAWDVQRDTFQQVKSGMLKSAFIFCQHAPVITFGRRANKKNILACEDELKARNIQTYEIERAGDVTYHGPGQLMFYPILNLNFFKKDIHWFLRKLEEIAILLLGEFAIKASRKPGLTGVWVGEKKIASIGVAIKNWITFHGLAINIKKDDLTNFSLIRPCGLDIMMTSLESETNKEVLIEQVKEILTRRLRNDQSSFA